MSNFAVAAGHPITVDAAADVLREGGSAVDAALAAAFTAMVAEPVLAGFFGGGFLMVREPAGQARLLDFFVQTPRRAVPEAERDFRAIEAHFGTATQEFHIGTAAIATPGVPTGLAEAHARFGRVPMRELVQPALTAARQGVEVTAYQAELGRIVAAILLASPESRALHAKDDATLPEGALARNPAFADVLETYAIEGSRFATEGEAAQALLELSRQGGHLQADDLKRYQPRWRDPLRVRRGEADVSINPPPSLGGALVAFGLALAEREPGPADLALCFEATTRARAEPALDRGPRDGAAQLLSEDFVQRYRREVLGRAASTRGTTHISVIDRNGMGAALTLSNGEGCGLIAPSTGIMPNNMLGEEDLLPDGFDSWTPDQRLCSMMAPLCVDWPGGRFAMLGSGGSNRIRTALVQVLIGLIDRNAALPDAIEAPRLHVEGPDPLVVDFEDIGGEERRDAILGAYREARAWADRSMFFGGVHGAMSCPRNGLSAAGDPRRAGVGTVG